MDRFMSSTSGAGSSSYSDFQPLTYPHIPLWIETCSMEEDYNEHSPSEVAYPSPYSEEELDCIFDPDFFVQDDVDIIHPDTPSSASSTSEVMTPRSNRGDTELPGGGLRSPEIVETNIEVCLNGRRHSRDHHIHHSSLPLQATFKSSSDQLPTNWPQLLATMCDQNPEAVQWFAEAGGFLPQSATTTIRHNATFSKVHCPSPTYPHQTLDTHPRFLAAPGELSIPATVVSTSASLLPLTSNSPSGFVPLKQPQPVRPIPQIPLNELAKAALHFSKPSRPRVALSVRAPIPLLCQPVSDLIRYQNSLGSADNLYGRR